jgi:hypothetical protein
MKLHYRTIRHIDSTFLATEPYETVHEFSLDEDAINPEYDGFSFSHSYACSKEEAQWILSAYDYPPVIEVDDADHFRDEYGFDDYKKYKWLDKTVAKR